MFRGARVAGLLLVGVLPALPAAAVPAVATFGRLPQVSRLTLSPDGSKYAFVLDDGKAAAIVIRALADNRALTVSSTAGAKVRSLQWVGSEHLVGISSSTASVIGLSGPRREWFLIQDYSLKKQRWKPLLDGVDGAMNVLSGTPTALMINDRPVLIAPGVTFPGNTGTSTLFRIDLDTGLARQSEVGSPDTIDWIIGDDGLSVARADYEQRSGQWRMLTRRDAGLRQSYAEVAALDAPALLALGSNGQTVLVSTHKSGDWTTHEVGLGDGQWSAAMPGFDADSLLLDPASRRVIGTVDMKLDRVDYRFLSADDQRVWNGIGKAFPGEVVTHAAWSDDRMTIIVEVEGPTNGDAFYVVDRKAKSARFLADRYAGIEPADLGAVSTFTYQAADGMDIPAYLTLPPGRKGDTAKGLPLILLAHGGPAARDNPGFDWWAQALASRGYAVLQPQFRGSDGFGEAHRAAGFGEWGRKMQSDLSDGVRHLAKAGTIDARRVCIVGGSYGGYAALAGVTVEQGVYRCAVAVAGVADLRRMLVAEMRDMGSEKNRTLRYWQRFMGAKAPDDPALDAISPYRLADKASAPVLLIHGKDDTVVLYEQSRIMEKALRDAGKPVELVTLPGEDHWLSRAATRIQMLEALVNFVERHNPPTAGAAAASAPVAAAR